LFAAVCIPSAKRARSAALVQSPAAVSCGWMRQRLARFAVPVVPDGGTGLEVRRPLTTRGLRVC
jgi:hypothetical protein